MKYCLLCCLTLKREEGKNFTGRISYESCKEYFSYFFAICLSFLILHIGFIAPRSFWKRYIWRLCGQLLVYHFNHSKVEEVVHHAISEAFQPSCNYFHMSTINVSNGMGTQKTELLVWAVKLLFVILLVLISRYTKEPILMLKFSLPLLLTAVTEVFLVIKFYFFGSICSTWKIYSPATVACKLAGLGRALCFRVVNIQWLTFYVPTCYSRQTSCAIYCSIWSLHPCFSCTWRKRAETWERGHSLLFWYFEVISACLLYTAACCLLDYNPSKKVSFPFRSYHNAPLLLPVCINLSLH